MIKQIKGFQRELQMHVIYVKCINIKLILKFIFFYLNILKVAQNIYKRKIFPKWKIYISRR